MAGAFTHIAVADTARHEIRRTELGKILTEQRSFLSLGSVSPDIPYLHHLSFTNDTWANIFHYFNTNGLIENGVHTLSKGEEWNDVWKAQLTWLCGFLAHLVTDATIHPIVEAAVGPVADPSTKSEHMKCEMVQDVLIMSEVMGVELISAEYTTELRDATVQEEFNGVMVFWAEHAHMNCPFFGRPDPLAWLKSYTDMLDTSEGGGWLGRIARHVGVSYAYDEVADIGPTLKERFYDRVALPTGQKGSFKKKGFDAAVKNVRDAWKTIEARLLTNQSSTPIAANWNLDTGIDQNTGQLTYWS